MEGGKTEMDDLLHHFGHEHQLLFVQHHKEGEEEEAYHLCGCCGYLVEGPSYRCSKLCKFFLHKTCAELELAPLINHPFHPDHPLIFLPESPYKEMGSYYCDFCGRGGLFGFVYHCASCGFDLDVNCAFLQPSSTLYFPGCLHDHPLILIENHKEELYHFDCKACNTPLSGPVYKCFDCWGFFLHMECAELLLPLNHPYDRTNLGSVVVHQHPLLPVQDHKEGEEEESYHLCGCCGKQVKGPSCRCSESYCGIILHKRCAELELPPLIKHPFHPQHPLVFLPKYPYDWGSSYDCCYCCRSFGYGFVYHCATCRFDLDVDCALFQPSITEEVSSCLHTHPLFLIENHKEELYHLGCMACDKPLFGPIYKCFDNCLNFYLHKECGELITPQINHPYDRAHPLFLDNSGTHQEGCSCYLCKIGWKGLGYCCFICSIELTLEEVTAPRTITDVASHQHPWTLVKYPISFICQFCGDEKGDRTPYICTICDLIVHKRCISLPRAIRIARHSHPISHADSLQQNQQPQELECRICYEEVNVRYGIYRCSVTTCNYIAHVNCATNKDVWDGTVVLEEDMSKEIVDSRSMITDVIREERVGEDVMATEIKHAFHHHNLILIISLRGATEMEDRIDNICDGCMLPISTPFYNCQQQECRFVLHKSCAELPRQMGHAIHKHLLKLTKNDDLTHCKGCRWYHHGFSYKCDQHECDGYEIDVQCSLLPDALRRPSHQHSLFLSYKHSETCMGYCAIPWTRPKYRCTKKCKFRLNFRCVRLPLNVRYKYDKHPLTLTYYDNSDDSQLYCDICEEKRDSKPWFYHCALCDNSAHTECALGELPFIKPGRLCRDADVHQHPLTFVDNIWDCPLCSKCGKLCYRQALQCKQSGCNFTVHWSCYQKTKYDL